jgi:8-oxo-dGTP pyrophosphatase MutT (NUDIX family)
MRPAVTCILFNHERTEVLLIKRRDVPVWVLPGGGIELSEAPEDAAIREMSEETGLSVKIVRKIAEYLPQNRLAGFTHFFEVEKLSGELSTGPETFDIAFFPLHALPKLLAPPYPYFIHDALLPKSDVIHLPIQGVTYTALLKLLFQHPILVIRFLLSRLGLHINKK